MRAFHLEILFFHIKSVNLDSKFCIQVSASVGVCCDPSFRIPIAIGSYPIRDFETDENGPAPTAPIETAPSATAPPYDRKRTHIFNNFSYLLKFYFSF